MKSYGQPVHSLSRKVDKVAKKQAKAAARRAGKVTRAHP